MRGRLEKPVQIEVLHSAHNASAWSRSFKPQVLEKRACQTISVQYALEFVHQI